MTLADPHGRPVTAQGMTVSLSSNSVPALTVSMSPDQSRSRWHSRSATVPLPGAWTLSLDVTLDPTDAFNTAVHYRVW